ncbi:MAG: hypothetical protein ACRDJC_00660 [Thermomicrobiales bacterium]
MPPAIDVARRFAEAVATLRAIHDFDDWIGQYWVERCGSPESAAAAHSTAGAEEMIVWHEGEETVFGFLPGYEGCFCIPRAVALPDFPFASQGPLRGFGQDIVISAAMREDIQPPGS